MELLTIWYDVSDDGLIDISLNVIQYSILPNITQYSISMISLSTNYK